MDWGLRERIVELANSIENYFSQGTQDINMLYSFKEQIRSLCHEAGLFISSLDKQTPTYKKGWEVVREMLVIAFGIQYLLDHPGTRDHTVGEIIVSVVALKQTTYINEFIATYSETGY